MGDVLSWQGLWSPSVQLAILRLFESHWIRCPKLFRKRQTRQKSGERPLPYPARVPNRSPRSSVFFGGGLSRPRSAIKNLDADLGGLVPSGAEPRSAICDPWGLWYVALQTDEPPIEHSPCLHGLLPRHLHGLNKDTAYTSTGIPSSPGAGPPFMRSRAVCTACGVSSCTNLGKACLTFLGIGNDYIQRKHFAIVRLVDLMTPGQNSLNACAISCAVLQVCPCTVQMAAIARCLRLGRFQAT